MNSQAFLAGRYDPRFARVFVWYTRRLFRKTFHQVRLARDSAPLAASLDADPAPLLVLMNHASWWDPLLGVLMHALYTPSRNPVAPMEDEQLRKFTFFTRLGLFGLDSRDPASLDVLVRHVVDHCARASRPALWITPQGAFTDVRAPVVLRPGAAAIAARLSRVRVITLAAEWTFWTDKRPEVLLRLAEVEPPPARPHATRSHEKPAIRTSAWHRTMTASMEHNLAALAHLAVQRQSDAFDPIMGAGARIHPIYDLLLKMRGKNVAIESKHEQDANAPA